MGIGPIQPVVMDGLQLLTRMVPGQVVRLQLVELGAGGGIVNLQGSLYRAAGNLPSCPGENFWAIIEQIGREQIRVRHVSPAPAESRGVPLSDLARALGLRDRDGDAGFVLRELMRWNLPVNRDTVQKLLREAAGLPAEERQAYLASRVWLMTLDLPDRASVIDRVLAYLLGRPDADLQGQELLNRSPTLHPELGQLYAFSINGGERLQGRLFLAVPYADGAEITADRARLVLSLETAAFGAFWVVLEAADGRLTGRIIAPDSGAARLFEAGLTDLERRLRAIGFTVWGLRVETGVYGSPIELLGADRGENTYVPLDARV